MAGTRKPGVFTSKRDVVVNPRATWFNRLQEIIKQMENGTAGEIPRIPKKQFEAADSKSKTRLLKQMLDVLVKEAHLTSDRNLICPFHNDTHPSMIYNNVKFDIHCFLCHENGETRDIFDLIKLFFGASNFSAQKQKAIELFVENGVNNTQTAYASTQKKITDKSTVSMSVASQRLQSQNARYYVPAWVDEDCKKFLINRGISQETSRKFNLKCWTYNTVKYLVIPCSNNFIVRRKVTTANNDRKFWLKKDVPVTLFNSERLLLKEKCIFITEGALDAITIEQLGYPAIALNGKGFYGKLLEQSVVIRSNDIYPIILLDNDDAGKDASKKLDEEFQARGIRSYLHEYTKFVAGEFLTSTKDVNDAYQLDLTETTLAISEIYKFASELRLMKPIDANDQASSTYIHILEEFGFRKVELSDKGKGQS